MIFAAIRWLATAQQWSWGLTCAAWVSHTQWMLLPLPLINVEQFLLTATLKQTLLFSWCTFELQYSWHSDKGVKCIKRLYPWRCRKAGFHQPMPTGPLVIETGKFPRKKCNRHTVDQNRNIRSTEGKERLISLILSGISYTPTHCLELLQTFTTKLN